MIDDENLKDSIIDSYYGEKNNIEINDELQAFEKKLNASLETMDGLKNLDYDLDINILEIINTAHNVQSKRKGFLETAGFLLCCIAIVSILIVSTVAFDTNFIIYAQIILSGLLPFALIPLAYFYKAKED